MKKIVAFVLSIIFTLSCFAGCGGTGANKGGDTKTIEINYWKSGLGEEWLLNVIAGFEKEHPEYTVVYNATASQAAIKAAFGDANSDTTDLYLGVKMYETNQLEPLDDILDATVNGESKKIREKFDQHYLDSEIAPDGKVYNLTYGGGMVGIAYNKQMFEEAGIATLPRTTDELVVACDTFYANDQKAFCHFKPVGYWEAYMTDVFFTQYNGQDYVQNTFYACVDAAGNSPSKEVFTVKDGRYEALKVFESIITPEYTLQGSSTYDHTTVQTMWLNGQAAMMVTGSWVESEMKSIASVDNFAMMKMPVISSIVDNLTTIKNDSQLRKVISAIDAVTDKTADITTYQNGDSYVIDDLTVSAADWEYVKAARNTMGSNYSGNSAYIPSYANAKEGAKEFLKYLYSDEGYKIYANTLNTVMPLSLSTGELDTSTWSSFGKSQFDLYRYTEQFATEYLAGKHAIFSFGGAAKFGSLKTYVNLFCTNNPADRLDAASAWEDIQKHINDNYENNWLNNIK